VLFSSNPQANLVKLSGTYFLDTRGDVLILTRTGSDKP